VRRPSLAEVAYRRAGFLEARRGLAYLACWGAVWDDLGRPFTMEEYAVWWKQSAKTSYREKAAFVKCFPGAEVADLWAAVGQHVGSRGLAATLEVGGVTAPEAFA
jgi:hypothetical protein